MSDQWVKGYEAGNIGDDLRPDRLGFIPGTPEYEDFVQGWKIGRDELDTEYPYLD